MRLRSPFMLLLVLAIVLTTGSTADAGPFKRFRERLFGGNSCASGSCESYETAASNGPGFTYKQLADGRMLKCDANSCQVVTSPVPPSAGPVPKIEAPPLRSPETITIDGRTYRLVPLDGKR